ncbi:MAG: hypothetical protein EOO17_04180 [Chloroflexi bacterium]|nr:MAG: hypothetical protein EOO17_04180 [Chloroflexota bacterium]
MQTVTQVVRQSRLTVRLPRTVSTTRLQSLLGLVQQAESRPSQIQQSERPVGSPTFLQQMDRCHLPYVQMLALAMASNRTFQCYRTSPRHYSGMAMIGLSQADQAHQHYKMHMTTASKRTEVRLLDVQSSSAAKLFSVNSGTNEYASNGGAEIPGPSSSTFPARTWNIAGVSTVDRYTTKGDYIESGNASVKIVSTGSYSGGYNVLSGPLTPSTTYTVSMSVKLETGSLTSFGVLYTSDGSNVTATCQDNVTVSTSAWTKVNCTFETPASGINADNTVAFGQLGPGAYTYYIDNLSVTQGGTINGGGSAGPNVQIGSGTGGNSTTLFTLDKSASAPVGANNDALLGSMYYDTTIGKVQCYESEGWGACGASPDTFVTLSPEFPNAVQNGTATGTMTTDFCSNTLNINNGTSGQANVCATNDTYNFYRWQASSSTTQTKSIYVTYKLPASFKQFASGTTSLLGRTDNANAAVTYQIYKNTATGLVACGSAVSVSSGVQATWQKATASGSADPATCGFTAGNDLVIRINMAGRTATNAYVSNLGFTFSNQ